MPKIIDAKVMISDEGFTEWGPVCRKERKVLRKIKNRKEKEKRGKNEKEEKQILGESFSYLARPSAYAYMHHYCLTVQVFPAPSAAISNSRYPLTSE